jgi:ubiquinone/menaquinone biosynthesis C-methylase UbiE
MDQKVLWENLAKENSRYYINSDKGKKITEKEFRDSGQNDYVTFIAKDELIDNRERILEIGCGIGRMTEFIAKDFNEVYGVDISGEMIKQGKERLTGVYNAILVETDGQSIPFDENFFNVVFSYLVFQHFKDKEMVEQNFKEVYRVLKPKGIFKVRLRTDINEDMEKWWSGVSYDDIEIDQLCKDTGFTLLKEEKVNNYGVWLWLEK